MAYTTFIRAELERYSVSTAGFEGSTSSFYKMTSSSFSILGRICHGPVHKLGFFIFSPQNKGRINYTKRYRNKNLQSENYRIILYVVGS